MVVNPQIECHRLGPRPVRAVVVLVVLSSFRLFYWHFWQGKSVSEACMKPAGSGSKHLCFFGAREISCSYTGTTCSGHIKVPNKGHLRSRMGIHINLGRHFGVCVCVCGVVWWLPSPRG